MLAINFEGWCQVRLATNPDPTDEPRGVSGYTFALAGEPDLDRVIRCHAPVHPRSHAPDIGVFVRSVSVDGGPNPEHPLVGGPVTLLNEHGVPPERPRDPHGPKFEARDTVFTDAGLEPISPFHLHISSPDGEIVLARKMVMYPEDPNLPIWKIPQEAMLKVGTQLFIFDSAEVAAATGILDRKAFRARRHDVLVKDLAEAQKEDPPDETAIAALEKRVGQFDIPKDAWDRRTEFLGGCETRAFELTGDTTVEGEKALGGKVQTGDAQWNTEFWFGGWDCDTLSAYFKGTLVLPFTRSLG